MLGASALVALGAALHSYSVSPELVPLHYGVNGVADRWGSPLELLAVQGGLVLFGNALCVGLPELVRRIPSAMLNRPDNEYWLTPEGRALAAARLADWANVLGTAVNALLLALVLLLGPTDGGAVRSAGHLPLVITALFVAFTLGWCVRLAALYRLPVSAR